MSGRSLKIALAVSVALNLFALAGGVAFAVSWARVDERVADLRRTGVRAPSLFVFRAAIPRRWQMRSASGSPGWSSGAHPVRQAHSHHPRAR